MVIKKITIPLSSLKYVLSETIIQGHLACEHNEQLKQVGGFIIPEIYFIANLKNSNDYFIGMEKLDGGLIDLIRTPKINIDTKSEYMYKCISNLAKTLYILQKSCNFMHRDLHIGNIMFKGDLDDLDNVKWYIIDFGFSYVDIKQTFYKDNKPYTVSKDIIAIKRFPNSKLNPSQDLRLFFLSIIEYNEAFNKKFNGWMTEHLIHTSTYLPTASSTIFHNAYEDIYSIIDPNLTPIHILKNKKPEYKTPIIPTNKKLTRILSMLRT
jgi:tRNA A-37 threonylcarbamoyl transferase component Bud32